MQFWKQKNMKKKIVSIVVVTTFGIGKVPAMFVDARPELVGFTRQSLVPGDCGQYLTA